MRKTLAWLLVILLMMSNTTGFMGMSFAEEVLVPVSDEPTQETETPIIEESPPIIEPEVTVPDTEVPPPQEPIESIPPEPTPEPQPEPIIEPQPVIPEPITEPAPIIEAPLETPPVLEPEPILESAPLMKSAPEPSVEPELLEAPVLQKAAAPDVSIMALIETPGNYPISSGGQLVYLEDDSTNNHTFAYMLWEYNGMLYVAVSSTHGTDYMIFDGVTNLPGNKDEYAPLVDITIGTSTFDPAFDVNGNTADARWDVYWYPLSDITIRDNEDVPYFIKSDVGRGHDVGGLLTLIIPKVDLTVNKEWVGGANLSVYIDVKNYSSSTGTNVYSTQNLTRADTGVTTATKTIKVPKISPYGATYTYSVEEKPVPTGYDVAYSGSNYNFTVTNTYNPEPATVNLSGTKALSGRRLANDAFSFTLYASDENGVTTGEALQTVKNVGANFSFQALSYDDGEEGTYYYVIREVNGGESGMTYDGTAFLVKVVVTDNGSGQLSAVVSYKVVGGDTATGVAFTNSYQASGSWTPMFTKSLTGRLLKNAEFSFEVREGENVKSTGTNNAAGSITFSAINYTQADVGMHTYTVHEIVPATPEGGMTYDTVAKTVTVNVVDAGGGVLTVTPTYPADTEFNNTYAASGSWTPMLSKVLDGRLLKDKEFSFILKHGESTIETVKNDAEGNIVFSAVSYTQADIGHSYDYTVQEVVPATPETGMTYDPMIMSIDVSVVDAGGGVLTITPTYPADKIFNNTYAASGSWTPMLSKVLDGRLLKDKEFSFILKHGESTIETVKNDAEGNIVFSAVSYTQADIGHSYDYTVQEVVPATPESGMTYDTLLKTISVSITDAGGGKLNVTPTYPKDTVFNNMYAASGSWIPMLTKELAGRTLAGGEFAFALKHGDVVLQTKTNTADGDIIFDAITYDEDDIGMTHTYTVQEVVPATPESGMTYDTVVKTITVNITDAGNGKLTVTPTYPVDKIFNNSYKASGQIALQVSKLLSGRALKAGEFSFQLKREGDLIETKTNALNGSVVFSPLLFGEGNIGDTYTYTIHEVMGTETGMTYDAMIVSVDVSVVDAGNGVLTVSAAYPRDTVFNNTYAASGSWIPMLTKELAGRDLANAEFAFELKHDDTVLQTKTNSDDGDIIFDAITYDQDDIGMMHTYTVHEVVPATPESGMTYDTLVKTITVNITDAGNGKLTVTPTYPEDSIFNNSYAASGSWIPMLTKELAGRTLAGGEFAFELKHGDAVLQTKTNTDEGDIIFDAITYDQDDIGMTHTYMVHEVVPATPESGMTYDAMMMTITVNIVDAGGGILTVTPTYPEDVIFNNSYKASGEVILEASKVLTGRPLAAGEFSFTIHQGDTLLQTKTNALNGDVVFDALSFDQEDIGKSFTYTVKEVPGTLYAMTYDTKAYTVIISVSDAGNGELAFDIDTDDMDLIFTNVFSIPEIDIPVQKVWSGDVGAAAVEIELLADGVPTGIVLKLEAANTWKGMFEDMDVAKVDGTPIVYTVRENTVLTGYTTTITGDKTLGFVVTNVQDPIILPNIPLTVTKKWVGGTGPSVVIEFYADGVWLKDQNLTLSASNNWTGGIEVPATDEGGKTIVYTIKEKAVSGYTAKITGDIAGGFTVTNTKIPVLPETGVGNNILIFSLGLIMGLAGLYLVMKHKDSTVEK